MIRRSFITLLTAATLAAGSLSVLDAMSGADAPAGAAAPRNVTVIYKNSDAPFILPPAPDACVIGWCQDI